MIVWNDWLLTAARTAIHLPTGTAVVADLHLGYAQVRQRLGEAVPGACLEEVLAPLLELLDQDEIAHLVVAGDLFEAAPDASLCVEFLRCLDATELESVRVVKGNHDRQTGKLPERLRPTAGPVLLGEWQVVHGHLELPPEPIIQGHVHPAWRPRPELPAVPCYLTRQGHLVLPAFSRDAAGVDVSRRTEWAGYHCHAIVGTEVLSAGMGGANSKRR